MWTLVPLTADELENRQQKLLQVVNEKKLHELWDILDAMKKLVMDDKRGVKVKSILISHPQLVTAIYEIQVIVFCFIQVIFLD
jgi:hypothetical protein